MARNRLLVPLLLVALVLSACAQNPATSQAPTATAQPTTAQVIQLQFWHGQSQAQQKTLNALIDQFNQSHLGIQVTAT
jgi:ABC-type glycerol-3-phosphate transport system substrate-binding protein